MNLVDIICILIILGFLLWGFKRGFILEISEIGGLIIAFLLSIYLPLRLHIGGWRYVVSFLVYFLIISIGFTILSKIVHKTPLALIDRILGSLMGAIKGIAVIFILFLIISVIPSANKKALNNSIFYNATLTIKPILRDFLEKKMKQPTPQQKKFPSQQEENEKII